MSFDLTNIVDGDFQHQPSVSVVAFFRALTAAGDEHNWSWMGYWWEPDGTTTEFASSLSTQRHDGSCAPSTRCEAGTR